MRLVWVIPDAALIASITSDFTITVDIIAVIVMIFIDLGNCL